MAYLVWNYNHLCDQKTFGCYFWNGVIENVKIYKYDCMEIVRNSDGICGRC